MALVFKLEGTRKGKRFSENAKVGGGRMTEEQLKQHYVSVNHPEYKDVKDLKVTLLGDDGKPAVDEAGTAVPPDLDALGSSSAPEGEPEAR